MNNLEKGWLSIAKSEEKHCHVILLRTYPNSNFVLSHYFDNIIINFIMWVIKYLFLWSLFYPTSRIFPGGKRDKKKKLRWWTDHHWFFGVYHLIGWINKIELTCQDREKGDAVGVFDLQLGQTWTGLD